MRLRFLVSLAVAVTCYSLEDMRKAELRGSCRTYCIKVQKLDEGKILGGRCACVRYQEAERLTSKTFTPVGDDSEVTGEFKTLPPYVPYTPSVDYTPPPDYSWMLSE